ncbi:hypothetical protein [Bacillus sp. V5-8f]|uniref:hypothetical protein n=1 Tax=Bacillus sp. V5-8f TaxID=2053044 RepID=UPI000C7921C7|nr:hypothetical protein [Bacillus sp. V5-8f]PLT32547.1 hypothetical protein CUU64_18775 [Bacillus sp. V5-8f]
MISIKVSYYDYLRGQVFIDGLQNVYGEDCPDEFDLGALISLLYDDFLYHTQKGARNHEQTVHYLMRGKAEYLTPSLPVKETKRKLNQVSPNTFLLNV